MYNIREYLIPKRNSYYLEYEEKEMSKGYIVGSIDKKTGEYSISGHPKIHNSPGEAQHEAERLAKLNQSKKYVVLGIGGICSASQVAWE